MFKWTDFFITIIQTIDNFSSLLVIVHLFFSLYEVRYFFTFRKWSLHSQRLFVCLFVHIFPFSFISFFYKYFKNFKNKYFKRVCSSILLSFSLFVWLQWILYISVDIIHFNKCIMYSFQIFGFNYSMYSLLYVPRSK